MINYIDEVAEKIHSVTSHTLRGKWSSCVFRTKDKTIFNVDFTKDNGSYMVWSVLMNNHSVTSYDVNQLEIRLNEL